MNATLTVLDFFKILYNIARSYPKAYIANGNNQQELDFKRTNTFAVVYRQSQIQSDNLDKSVVYKGKELFYSRYWEETQNHPSQVKFYYPALCVAEANGAYEKVFEKGYPQTKVFNLFVMDRMPDKLMNTVGASPKALRTFEEVGQDLEDIMNNILYQFDEFYFYNFNDLLNGGAPVSGWFPVAFITAKEAASEIDNVVQLEPLTSRITEAVTSNKAYGVFSDNLAGYFVNITVSFDSCEAVDFSYDNYEFTPNYVPDNSIRL